MPDFTIPDLPVLENGAVRVRPWRHDDVATVIEASHDDLIPVITTVPTDADEAAAHDFIDRQIGRPESDHGHARAIADPATDEAIGHLYTSMIHLRVGRAEMGYWVLACERGRGIASAALDLTTTWVLTNTQVQRVTLFIEPWNEGSIGVARRAGFEKDGLLREWETYTDGVPRDMLAFRRLREDG